MQLLAHTECCTFYRLKDIYDFESNMKDFRWNDFLLEGFLSHT